MRIQGLVAIILCFLPLGARDGEAAVVFGYDVNTSPQHAKIAFDGQALVMQLPATAVDLSATREGNSDAMHFANAFINLDAQLTSSQTLTANGSPYGSLLKFAGEMSFVTSDFESIVAFTFDDAALVLADNAGASALTWASREAAGASAHGPALDPLLGPLFLDNPASFVLTLTHLQGDADAFSARSSFSADATAIPEPASAALLGFSSFLLLRRPRRS